jgi:uncharacterized protein (TIGR01777 family)
VKVLVSGSTGLIGSALVAALTERGDEVHRLVRRQPVGPNEVYWDPTMGDLDPRAVEGFDSVVHLAGAGIGDKRWSDSRRKLILDSRVQPTRLLAARLAAADAKPKVFISSSAIGFYGDRAEPVDETSQPPDPPDFLSGVTAAWEEATGEAEAAGIRVTHIRTGIVLSDQGGALRKLLLPFRAGVGGKLGSGETWWSWISLEDEIRAILFLIDNPLDGPVNLTSPNPVKNRELTKALGNVLRRPNIPVPKFALNVILGEDLADALLFTSVRVMPTRLQDAGFEFAHPEIRPALESMFKRDEKTR